MMRRFLSVLLLAAVAAFSFAQVSSLDASPLKLEPAISVSNRVTASTSARTFRQQILDGRRLIGVNVTDSGCAPLDPVAAARLLKSYGVNWVRLHHIDRGLIEGWWTAPQIIAFMDAGKAEGIRFSVDGASKLGEVYDPARDFKADLYAGRPEAIALYHANIERIKPILQHPACFMACLVNEPASRATPAQVTAFFRQEAPTFRQINPNLLLTDASDAWAQAEHPSPYAEAASLYDVITIHDYNGGEDFGPNGLGTWIGEGWITWKIRLFVARARELATKKLPALIQEFGSYSVNKFYGANEMFLQVMAAIEGWSTCQFAFVTNQDGWIGKSVDKYAAVTDQLRLNMLLLGSLLSKESGLKLDHWDGTTGNWGPSFRVSGEHVQITQDFARIGSYMFTWNPQARWVWLVKPIQ